VTPEPDNDAVREQLRRILSSRTFTASDRMSRFLRFVVEMSLDGRAGELKEYSLGVEVFDRSPSFDPRIDPIVRIEARRLRGKLKTYYETYAGADELVIELPTGSYAPRFHRADRAPRAADRPALTDIAVLPFANLDGDPGADYISEGLTEELIHTLTRIDALRVVAWTSAAKFRDRQDDFRRIGEELKVGAIVTGSVRKSADRLRVTARLIDTAGGYYRWSEIYDRGIEDLFAIQQEIAASIAASLKTRLLGAPGAGKLPHASRAAYDLYLRGRFQWNKRTPEGFDRGIQYFQEAIAADPQFAPAYAGLADGYSLCADHGLTAPSIVMPQAKAAALRAIELDPDLAEAHTSLGLIRSLYEWQWQAAGEHYRRAIELNPGYATAHYWYGCDYLALLGRSDDAVAEMRTALRLDPLSHVMTQSLAYVLLLARRFDEALEQHMNALELEPYFYKSYSGLGRLYIHMEMYGEAIAMLQKARSLAGDVPNLLGALGQAYARAGREQDARALLARLEELSKHRYVPSTSVAMIYAGLGENARALDWLETASRRRELTVSAIGVHPGYDTLRGEPRLASLMVRIGLTAEGVTSALPSPGSLP
jgi:serine/threonine-protein kinase